MPSPPTGSPAERPPTSPAFRRIEDAPASLRLRVEGSEIAARPGDTVAVALLAAGIAAFRDTPLSRTPRGPWCMMGTCFECLVTIDGVANRQACLVAAIDGMRIERQHGARSLG